MNITIEHRSEIGRKMATTEEPASLWRVRAVLSGAIRV